jgi:uncharacterized DUF497 family protein
MSCEWDPRKAEANFRKHAIRLSEAEPVFDDAFAVTFRTMSRTRMSSDLFRLERA